MIEYRKIRVIYSNGLKLDYGWVLYIDSILDLVKYHKDYNKSTCENAMIDFLRSSIEDCHYSDPLASAMHDISLVKKESPIISALMLLDDIFKGQFNALIEYGSIYVQSTGSYMWLIERHSVEILDIISYDSVYDWPQNDIIYTIDDVKIIKWPNGSHYYAKFGRIDVVINGEQKWNSEEEAKKMAERFLQEEIQ